MKKIWLVGLLSLSILLLATPAFADDDDSSSSSSSSDGPESSGPSDEYSGRVKNDLVFDSADLSAPVFSKSNETFRAPASVAERQINKIN